MADEGRKEMKSTDTHIAAALPPRFDKCPEASQSVGTRHGSQSIRSSHGDGSFCAEEGKSSKRKCRSIYPLFFFFFFYFSSQPRTHKVRGALAAPLPHINLTWSNWRDADEFEIG